MYIKDALRIVDPPCDNIDEAVEDCDDDHHHQILDSGEGHEDYVYMKAPCVYLDHSCDNWVIGGPKEVEVLIEDLQKVLHKWQDEGQHIKSIDKVP